VVKTLERRHLTTHNHHSAAPFQPGKDKHLIEFTNGHVQLDWERGRWILRNWKDMETCQPTWIQPEENFLSALIRPPSRTEPISPAHNPEANRAWLETRARARLTENHTQEQTTLRQEWPHPNTATMVEYLKRMDWKTPFLRRLRSINIQWKMAIDSLESKPGRDPTTQQP